MHRLSFLVAFRFVQRDTPKKSTGRSLKLKVLASQGGCETLFLSGECPWVQDALDVSHRVHQFLHVALRFCRDEEVLRNAQVPFDRLATAHGASSVSMSDISRYRLPPRARLRRISRIRPGTPSAATSESHESGEIASIVGSPITKKDESSRATSPEFPACASPFLCRISNWPSKVLEVRRPDSGRVGVLAGADVRAQRPLEPVHDKDDLAVAALHLDRPERRVSRAYATKRARHAPRRPRGGTLSRPCSQESRARTRTLASPRTRRTRKAPTDFSVVSFGRHDHDPDALPAHVAVRDAATPWSCMIRSGLVTASRSPAPRRCCCCCLGSPKRNAPSREKKKRKKRNTKENQK